MKILLIEVICLITARSRHPTHHSLLRTLVDVLPGVLLFSFFDRHFEVLTDFFGVPFS